MISPFPVKIAVSNSRETASRNCEDDDSWVDKRSFKSCGNYLGTPWSNCFIPFVCRVFLASGPDGSGDSLQKKAKIVAPNVNGAAAGLVNGSHGPP
jgi:hypothetical protein